jgi:hypothetical protein
MWQPPRQIADILAQKKGYAQIETGELSVQSGTLQEAAHWNRGTLQR